jgi:hypothetical protein
MFGSSHQQQQQKRTIQGSLSKGSSAKSSGIWRIGAVVMTFATLVVLAIHGRRVSRSSRTASSGHAAETGPDRESELVGIKKVTSSDQGDFDGKEKKVKTSPNESLLLKTAEGNIRIVLRPDLSPESVMYIHEMLQVKCSPCNLYRSEAPGILQGILQNESVEFASKRGECPPGFESVENTCPEWDLHCGCHGPIMTKGMVGWAAGETGPDFFINNYDESMEEMWGTQHTVWGGMLRVPLIPPFVSLLRWISLPTLLLSLSHICSSFVVSSLRLGNEKRFLTSNLSK